MFFTKKVIALRLLAILPLVVPSGSTEANPFRTKRVDTIGTFCHTGTVVMVLPARKFLLELPEGRMPHHFMATDYGMSPGDIIEASGIISRHSDNTIHESVFDVKRIGHASLPPPRELPLPELAKCKFLNKRVTTEGTLVHARQDEIDVSAVQLLVKDGTSVLNVAFMTPTNQTLDACALLGARLRITGVMLRSAGARRNATFYLATDSPSSIKVIRPPPADIFNAPELDFDPLLTPNEIVRMDSRRFEGIVLATWGGNQMMLEGKDFHRVKTILARPEELPVAGEHVAVVGFPDTDLYGINLNYARCKPLPEKKDIGAEPKPVDVTLRQLLTDDCGRPRINGYSHGWLLRIHGTVLDVQPSLALFSLNDDGLTMPVGCSSSPHVLSRLETNSRIEAVILALVETDSWRENIVLPQTRGLKLILRSANDIKVISRPPWWTPARLTMAIVALLALIVLIVVGNRVFNRIMMRRKVAERTRLAVELHDSLSQTLAGVACQIAAGHGAISDDPETAKSLLETAERMLQSSRTELKNCLFDLRNDTVDDPDFKHAISKTLAIFRSNADIAIRFNVARTQMTDTTAHAVLCIIRELVANAIRHGSAKRISVAGATDSGHLLFSVCDNGCGFNPERHPGPRDGHFGLAGISERLANLGGEMAISSKAGAGSKVTVKIMLGHDTLASERDASARPTSNISRPKHRIP